MSKEAMKLALEALQSLSFPFGADTSKEDDAIRALSQAIAEAEKQEPVAWLFQDRTWTNIKAMADDHPPTVPVYTTPQPKQEQGEPVAITITGKLGNIYSFTGDYSLKKGDNVYTTPQQRKPLTNENPLLVFAKECVLGAYSEDELADAAFKAIEAAHGIKGEA
jgi:hypothetical protein